MNSEEKRETIKRALTETREALLQAVAGLSEAQWQRPAYSTEAEGGEWRTLDVLRHLADSERGMTTMMAQLKAGGAGVPDDFDLQRWNRSRVSKLQDKSAADLLAAMQHNRAALFDFIDTLEENDWPKKGRHASGHIMTIEQICRLIGYHERGHLREIEAAVGG